MKEFISKFSSNGRITVPAELRRKHGIKAGTTARFSEDKLGRIILHPVTEQYIDRVMGCLRDGPDLLKVWMREHREEPNRRNLVQ